MKLRMNIAKGRQMKRGKKRKEKKGGVGGGEEENQKRLQQKTNKHPENKTKTS